MVTNNVTMYQFEVGLMRSSQMRSDFVLMLTV